MNKKTLYASMVLSIILTSCGGGGSTGGGGGTTPPNTTTVNTNLKGALNKVLPNVPVLITTVNNQANGPVANANLSLTFKKGTQTSPTLTATTAPNGTSSLPVTPNAYDYVLKAPLLSKIGSWHGNGPKTVAATPLTQFDNLKTDEMKIIVSPPTGKTLSQATINVFQKDAAGNIIDQAGVPSDYQATSTTLDPYASTMTFSFELFKGDYEAVVFAVDTYSSPGKTVSFASQVQPLTSQGIQSQATVVQVPMSLTGNTVSLTLQDTAGNALTGYKLRAIDTTQGVGLSQVPVDIYGVGNLLIDPKFTDLTVLIKSPTDVLAGTVSGIFHIPSLTADVIKTLAKQTVKGSLTPSTGGLDPIVASTVNVKARTTIGLLVNIPVDIYAATASAGQGVFSVDLFPGTYEFSASNVKGFPSSTTQTATVAAGQAAPTVSIPVSTGGTIFGRLQDDAKNNLPKITVEFWGQNSLTDKTATQVATAISDVNGNYSVELPLGTYDIRIQGATTLNVALTSAASSKNLDLVRYQVTGRHLTEANVGLDTATITVLNGGPTTTTQNIGVYTLKLFEGANSICIQPNPLKDAQTGQQCDYDVLVDAATVAASKL